MGHVCNLEMERNLPVKPTPTPPLNTVQEDTHAKLLTRVCSDQIVILPTQCVVAYHDVSADRAISTMRGDWGCGGSCETGGRKNYRKETGKFHGKFGGGVLVV
jgi:hypothetical protein